MTDVIVSLSFRIATFLGCCKRFAAFDMAGIFDLDAWASYRICESLVSSGIMTKYDPCPDDSDFDDIVYFPKLYIYFGDVYNTMMSLDKEVIELIN
jgi:hypothetical protein